VQGQPGLHSETLSQKSNNHTHTKTPQFIPKDKKSGKMAANIEVKDDFMKSLKGKRFLFPSTMKFQSSADSELCYLKSFLDMHASYFNSRNNHKSV
jgi:hypothetical protein